MTDKTGKLQSVRRTTNIIELLVKLGGGTVSEVAEKLNLAPSTVHGYLATLYEQGYLIKEDNEYQIGTKFLQLGEYSRTREKRYKLAEEKILELAEKTNERSQFVIEEFGWGIFLYRKSGTQGVETGSEIGKRIHLHSNAAGKAILAHLPESKVTHIIDQNGLPAMTSETITDETTLFQELKSIRDQGYALNKNESVKGLSAVGVPVQTEDKAVLGALSVSGPSNRLKGDYLSEELTDLLLGTANELELRITYRE